MDIDQLTRSEKTTAGAGIVLVVDLVFLPWHSVDLGIATWARSATESPGRLWGILAVVLTAAVVASTVVRAVRPDVRLPELPVTWAQATLAGAVGALGLLVLKLALDADHLGIGAWLGLVLATAMALGAAAGLRADGATGARTA